MFVKSRKCIFNNNKYIYGVVRRWDILYLQIYTKRVMNNWRN